MSEQCKFIRSNGQRCQAIASKDDPDGFCAFHSQHTLYRKHHIAARFGDVTNDELIEIVSKAIRSLAKVRNLDPLEKAKQLIQLTQELRRLKSESTTGQSEEPKTELDAKIEEWKKSKPNG